MKFRSIAALVLCAPMLVASVAAQDDYTARPQCHARKLRRMGDYQAAQACREDRRAWRHGQGNTPAYATPANPGYAPPSYAAPAYTPTNTYAPPDPAPGSTEDISTQLAQGLDRLVAYDAQSWFANVYTPGSITNVNYATAADGRTVVSANYNYTGPLTNGAIGWVKVYVSDGKLDCIEYHDFQGECRPIGDSPGRREAAKFFGQLAFEYFTH